MLKDLWYQRAMTLANAGLIAGLVLYVIVAVIARAPESVEARNARSGAGADATLLDLPDSRVEARGKYNVILDQKIFGAAAEGPAKKIDEPKPVVKKQESAEETKLPLRLLGTVVAGDGDQLASAVIEARRGGAAIRTFYIDQPVLEGVFLREVFDREVLLENTAKGQMERLKIKLEN